MIKIKIFHQDNIGSPEELIYEGEIHREPTNLREHTTYKAVMNDIKSGPTLRARVTKFPSRRMNALDLLYRVLNEMIGYRNGAKTQSRISGNRRG